MGEETLYITAPDCELRRSGRWLRLEREGQCLAKAAPSRLGHVMVFGDTALQPGAVSLLLRHSVPVSFLDGRGRFLGRLIGAEPSTPSLREAQYRCAADADYARRFAAEMVARKLATARELLYRHQRNTPDLDLSPQLSGMLDIRDEIPATLDLGALRGLEGHAAALYFEAFRNLLRRPHGFAKRTRRPPRDEVNALLSFGYCMVHAEITGQVSAVGLDPQVGFLHVRRAGRAALPLDLVEEFRIPVVDRLVLRCWNLGILTPADFTWDDGRVPLLTRPGRERFLREYERRMAKPFRHVNGFWTNCRRLLHGQARAVAHCVRHGEDYHGLPVRL